MVLFPPNPGICNRSSVKCLQIFANTALYSQNCPRRIAPDTPAGILLVCLVFAKIWAIFLESYCKIRDKIFHPKDSDRLIDSHKFLSQSPTTFDAAIVGYESGGGLSKELMRFDYTFTCPR